MNETNRSFNRTRSKFADPRYRPRGRITKSVTVTTAYNRTIRSGTAGSAQKKVEKAVLQLKRPVGLHNGERFFRQVCVFVVRIRRWADVGMWVAVRVLELAKNFSVGLRARFARLTQSHAVRSQ